MVYSDVGVGWERWSYIKGALCFIFLVLCHESVTMMGAAAAAAAVVYFVFNTFVLKKGSRRLFLCMYIFRRACFWSRRCVSAGLGMDMWNVVPACLQGRLVEWMCGFFVLPVGSQ